MTLMFGWCMDGSHGPSEKGPGCPAVIPEHQFPDPARKGTFYTIPERRCPCVCHQRNLDSLNESKRKA